MQKSRPQLQPLHLKSKKTIPFEFVLELLAEAEPVTRSMFGCTAIYTGGKIRLILRDKPEHRADNGVWLATSPEHHLSLSQEFPSLRSIALFGSEGPTSWQNLPADQPDFESSVERVCRLVLKDDPRVGKEPRPKRSAKRSKST
jgi:hypothetical protein